MKKKLKKIQDKKIKQEKETFNTSLKFLIKDPSLIKYKFIINSSFDLNYIFRRIFYALKKQ